MGDRFWGRIDFPARMIDAEIREALEEEGVGFNDQGIIEKSPEFYGDEVVVEDGIVTMSDQEANYGCFSDLEDLLRKKGVPFDRQSGQAYDYTPELVIFRPAQDGAPALDLTIPLHDDEPIISVMEIRELLAQGVEAAMAYLDQHFPAYSPLSDFVKEASYESG